ncbi:MAG: LysM peptidoglycan-binding domain-containing protein [Phycisphaerales bacterium]|nr:LysM peptidoglycan-binding domain-containing protein [Phycisphaerales bacterium]
MTIGGKLILLGFGGALILLVVVFGGGPAVQQAVQPAASAIRTTSLAVTEVSPRVQEPIGSSNVEESSSASVLRQLVGPVRSHRPHDFQPMVTLPSDQDDSVVVMGMPIPAQHAPAPLDPARAVHTVAATDQPASSVGPRRYTIKPGDTLSEIAWSELGSAQLWTMIVEANPGLDPNRLRVGGTVRIPALRATPASTTAAKSANSLTSGRTHTVAAGDSLSSVAIAYYENADRWHDVYMANATLLQGDPDRLQLGMVLVIP